jgi:hypothetical protein
MILCFISSVTASRKAFKLAYTYVRRDSEGKSLELSMGKKKDKLESIPATEEQQEKEDAEIGGRS